MLMRESYRSRLARRACRSCIRSFTVSSRCALPPFHPQDTRQAKGFETVKDYLNAAHAPAFGKPSQASQPSSCPTQPLVAVKVGIRDSLDTSSRSQIAIINTSTGRQRLVSTKGRSNDSYPRWSPNGQQLAFISDRREPGTLEVFILDNAHLDDEATAAVVAPSFPGTPEALSWSPDGSRLLVQIAERGADQAAAHGSSRLGSNEHGSGPSWRPTVKVGGQETGWRSLWVYEPSSRQVRHVSVPGLNVWEATWLGKGRVLAVVSDSPTEDAWYDTSLAIIDVETDRYRTVYRPKLQLGLPTASPSGSMAAFVECLCSDRGGVAGPIFLLHAHSGDAQPQRLDLNGVDVTHLQWLSEDRISFMGLRGTYTVAGHYYVSTGLVEEHWVSDQACGPLYPEGTVTQEGEFSLISESWNQAQQLVVAHHGQSRSVVSWAHEGTRWVESQLRPIQSTTWTSSDGLEIQGYLAMPPSSHKSPKPYPLILNVHGGPVWTFRNTWCLASPILPLLVSQGFAVLSANPRGSTGRGPEFTSKVLGDMGGMDAQDLLSGVDAMVSNGVADRDRLGVMGVSYGGYMAAWLPTLSPCFKAAVPIAPVTNWYSNHHTSNIGRFDELFFQQGPRDPGNMYHTRSPVMFAGKHPTSVMQVVGEKDYCVPPSQAFEYDRALRDNGVDSTLVVYPEEGHGIRQYPAYIDFCARVLGWFEQNLRK